MMDGNESLTSTHRPSRRRHGVRFAAFVRWLHIYLSMFGLAAVLFFSVTGLTLNHPNWFLKGVASQVQTEGQVDRRWLHLESPAGLTVREVGLEREVDKLEVVEYLRKTHNIRGALAEFRVDEVECIVTFKGPAYAADAFVDRESGQYKLSQSYEGFVAVLNDLHKGRDSGMVWGLVIDISAAGLALISLTGLLLILYLKLRRGPGLAVALIGMIVVVAIFVLGVQ